MANTETTRLVNAEALEAMYRENWGEMTAVAARLLRDRDIPEAVVGAEDLVQTAFERALDTLHVLREPRAYIYTIVRHEVSYWAQRLHREQEWEAERLTELRTSVAQGGDTASLVTNRVMVRDGVRRLPQQQARAVVATKMYDLTQHEWAANTGRHPGTVAVHITRAVASLALFLTPVLILPLILWTGGGWGTASGLSGLLTAAGLLASSVHSYSAYRGESPVSVTVRRAGRSRRRRRRTGAV